MSRVDVVVEMGRRRTFASALDWPGWARSGRTPDDALVSLASYRARYADVLGACRLDAPTASLRVVETVPGDAGTDFGALTSIAERDRRALRPPDRARLAAILTACWSRFDDVVATAGALRSGPRGGGRSLDAIRRHVADAEVAYARGLGLRVGAADGGVEAVASLRERQLDVLLARVRPEREGRWPPRYAARRVAWHVCDHLFEIEDRDTSR